MKKILVSILTLSSFAVNADELSTYAAVADAVAQGKKITFVLDFKECTSRTSFGDAIASITPSAIIAIGNTRITASYRHFTLDDPEHSGSPVFEHSKFNINPEGTATIKTTVINAVSYAQLGSYFVHCHLGKGFKAFG